ncbi:unnamed protein product, partial [Closterium sp. NIES-53]
GKGVARGGSSYPRALQSHAQLRPRPPPPPPWGQEGEGVRGWRMCLSSSSCRHASSSLSPCRTLCWERGGELGSSGGGGRGSAAPAPPPFLLHPLLQVQQWGGVWGWRVCEPSPPPPPPPSPTATAAAEGGGCVGAEGVVLGG